MYRLQNIHTHSNGTAPSRKSFPALSLHFVCTAGEAGPAVSSVQDDPTPTERAHSKLRSLSEGNSGDGNSGASPGLPEAARHVGESAPGYVLLLAPVPLMVGAELLG